MDYKLDFGWYRPSLRAPQPEWPRCAPAASAPCGPSFAPGGWGSSERRSTQWGPPPRCPDPPHRRRSTPACWSLHGETCARPAKTSDVRSSCWDFRTYWSWYLEQKCFNLWCLRQVESPQKALCKRGRIRKRVVNYPSSKQIKVAAAKYSNQAGSYWKRSTNAIFILSLRCENMLVCFTFFLHVFFSLSAAWSCSLPPTYLLSLHPQGKQNPFQF